MYQSLYRKYRPKSFDDVVGQKVIVETLKNSIKKEKIAHAYLFTGPRGTGKTSIAKILAKTINCDNLNNISPCNNCDSCKSIDNKQTIDILEIDAASNNGVDEIREINNKVSLVPSIGKYKVYIIDEVHMLTTGAFNALLKTLEEPPSHIVFILATTEPHKIPATILSRCQRFDFKKLSKDEISERIKYVKQQEQIEIEDSAIEEIALLSDGGMRDALSILDQAVAYSEKTITLKDIHEINGTITQREISEIFKNIFQKEIKNIFDEIDLLDKNGKDFVKLLEEMIYFLRNLLLYIVVPNYYNDIIDIYEELKEKADKKEILFYIEEFNNTLNNMKNNNNPKLLFELLIIKIIDNNEITENKINSNEISKNKNNIINQETINNKKIISELKIEPTQNEELIKKIQKVRINNALCDLNKTEAINIKEQISKLTSLLIDDKYSKAYSMILDGKLAAFGNNILIFVYESVRDSAEFNQNLQTIDELLKKNIKKEYEAIAVDMEKWNNIKKEYSLNKNKYQIIDESKLYNNKIEDVNKNSIEQMFDNMIEYS